jgi:cytochrome c peroxidase
MTPRATTSLRALACAAALAPALAAQLPAPYVPPQNPQSPAKIVLGKVLFWDEQLSSDDTVACGTCHLPEFGGSDGRPVGGLHPGADNVFGTADDVHGSAGVVKSAPNGDFAFSSLFGVSRQATGRTSQSTLGAAHHAELFWDGRASTQFVDPETGATVIPVGGALESQAVGPILNPVEMGRPGRTWQDVRSKLQSATPLRLGSNLPPDVAAALQQNPTYPALFTAAFGDALLAMQPDQLVVHAHWRAAGGQAEHGLLAGGGPLLHEVGDLAGDRPAGIGRLVIDGDGQPFHRRDMRQRPAVDRVRRGRRGGGGHGEPSGGMCWRERVVR